MKSYFPSSEKQDDFVLEVIKGYPGQARDIIDMLTGCRLKATEGFDFSKVPAGHYRASIGRLLKQKKIQNRGGLLWPTNNTTTQRRPHRGRGPSTPSQP